MKKILTLIALCTLAAVVLPSCKKDYNCVCTDSNGDRYDFPITNSRRPEAKISCDVYDLAYGDCSLD